MEFSNHEGLGGAFLEIMITKLHGDHDAHKHEEAGW